MDQWLQPQLFKSWIRAFFWIPIILTDFPYISLFPYNYSLILPYFAPFWAGPPCRPARFFFEGPRAPLGSGRGAPCGAPQKRNLAGRHGGPAPHTIFYTIFYIYICPAPSALYIHAAYMHPQRHMCTRMHACVCTYLCICPCKFMAEIRRWFFSIIF